HNFSPLVTYFSDVTYRKMDPKLREGFLDAAGKAAVDTRAHGLAVEKEATDVLKSDGVTVIPCDREQFRVLVLPQTDAFMQRMPQSKPIIEIIKGTTA
ncbi:MAG: ABC transporter substrate-binding protein, partial [Pseudomonadota bacterium]|nr:ABC transporter substrate-binding protein [Pseudomonadota bacterium]